MDNIDLLVKQIRDIVPPSKKQLEVSPAEGLESIALPNTPPPMNSLGIPPTSSGSGLPFSLTRPAFPPSSDYTALGPDCSRYSMPAPLASTKPG